MRIFFVFLFCLTSVFAAARDESLSSALLLKGPSFSAELWKARKEDAIAAIEAAKPSDSNFEAIIDRVARDSSKYHDYEITRLAYNAGLAGGISDLKMIQLFQDLINNRESSHFANEEIIAMVEKLDPGLDRVQIVRIDNFLALARLRIGDPAKIKDRWLELLARIESGSDMTRLCGLVQFCAFLDDDLKAKTIDAALTRALKTKTIVPVGDYIRLLGIIPPKTLSARVTDEATIKSLVAVVESAPQDMESMVARLHVVRMYETMGRKSDGLAFGKKLADWYKPSGSLQEQELYGLMRGDLGRLRSIGTPPPKIPHNPNLVSNNLVVTPVEPPKQADSTPMLLGALIVVVGGLVLFRGFRPN